MRLNIFCATTPFTKIQNQQRRRYNYSIILQCDIIITQLHHKTAKFNFIAKKREAKRLLFFVWQGWKESNPPLEFWRLSFYR